MAPQFDKPLRDLLRAAGCEPAYRQRYSAAGWLAEGFLRQTRMLKSQPLRHKAQDHWADKTQARRWR